MVYKIILSVDLRNCNFEDPKFIIPVMCYLPNMTSLYLPDELLADNGDAYNIHIIKNEDLFKNKKLFAYKPLEANPEYISKVLLEATEKEVTHLRFQYTHFNGLVEDWEKGLDGENV